MSKKGGGDGVYTQEFKCAVCGKVRYRNKAWVYKRGSSPKIKYFCGYNCMNQYDKKAETARKAKEEVKEAKKEKNDKART